jgi:hypothetical protein
LKLGIILILAFSIQAFSAGIAKPEEVQVSLVEKWRPTISKFFGEEFTIKLLGKIPEIKKVSVEIQMPKIPLIKDDARSADVYNKKADKITLHKNEEEKYHYSFLEELYEVTRQTKPNQEEFQRLMNTLSQGATREGVYHALVLDAAYAQLENSVKPVKDSAADFTVYFYGIYIAKIISPEGLKKMNMYSLKRLVAEKALDMIDAFGDNREDLEKWYAVLSSDLATRFPQLWSNKLRKSNSKAVHKNWASKAPIQHIKSETVIKIHMAFNSLM